jgi:NAD(P)H-nitrite reductase large subunit
MDTSAQLDIELRKATVERKKLGGPRCLGKQRDGHYALTVGVPTACFSAQQLHDLADIVDKYARVGHLSTGQSMVLLGIQQQDYYQARQAVLDAGLQVRSVGRDVFQVKCCPGADYSPFGLQRTFSLVTLLEETFRCLPTPQKFKISVSGCPNCCANTRLADFGVHAAMKGWKVYVGGKMGFSPVVAEEIASDVSADEVIKYLAAVLRAYRELAQPNEKLAMTIKRLGLTEFKAAVEQFLDLPFDDLAALAQESRQKMERAEIVGPGVEAGKFAEVSEPAI